MTTQIVTHQIRISNRHLQAKKGNFMIRVLAVTLLALFLGGQMEAQKIKHVVLIGIDGLGANYYSKEQMPTLANLMATGSYSLHARSVLPSSSADNWASMFMGASPELHGYTVWDSKTPEFPSRTLDKYGLFSSIYSVLRDQQPKADIGVFYDWPGIGYLFPHDAVNKYSLIANDSDDDVVQQATDYLKSNKPTLLLVYMEGTDEAGHTRGWGSAAYLEEEAKIDKNIARVIAAIHDAGLSDSTVVLVSADHGGLNQSHGGKTLKEMEIPWVITGPDIKRGYEIKDSIMTYDTAATIAYIFRLKVPQAWIGRPVRAAFSK